MKITFEKGMEFKEAISMFYDTFFSYNSYEFEDIMSYPILKTNLTIEFELKNEKGQIYTNNEIDYYFGKEKLEEKHAYEKSLADEKLKEEWEYFTSDSHYKQLIRDIENDRRYIETAKVENRKPGNVEIRKKLLEKHEKELLSEKKKLDLLKKFVDMVSNKSVKYEYKYYKELQIWGKRMNFDFIEEGVKISYVFSYEPHIEYQYTGDLYKVTDKNIIP